MRPSEVEDTQDARMVNMGEDPCFIEKHVKRAFVLIRVVRQHLERRKLTLPGSGQRAAQKDLAHAPATNRRHYPVVANIHGFWARRRRLRQCPHQPGFEILLDRKRIQINVEFGRRRRFLVAFEIDG